LEIGTFSQVLSVKFIAKLHYKNPTQCVGLVQSEPHHHLIEN